MLRLHRQRKYEHVISAINAALIHGHAQPWMYDVLALTMKLAGRPVDQIERVLLSQIDFTGGDVPAMLYSAAYLSRFGAEEQALRLYRQAGRLDPTRPEPYALGLKLARARHDYDAIEWAVVGILTYTWPADFRSRHRDALAVAEDAVAELEEADRAQRARELSEAVVEARRRDLMVTLSWSGVGDLDLSIEEPLGTVCHFDNPFTRGGGSLIHDGYGPVQSNCYEEYVCAFGSPGEYRLVIEHIAGNIVGKRATLSIHRYVGTPHEQVHRHPVVLGGEKKVIRLTLRQGRRTEPTRFLPSRPDLTGTRTRRRPAIRFATSERSERPARRAGRRPGVGYTPVVTLLSEGVAMTALAVVSGDRRYVRLTVNPVITTITDVYTFTFAGRGAGGGGRLGGGQGGGRQ